ncbi:MAG: efflux RND transporter periplasmic adaptor subunit [Halieaceae bacterium]
MRTIVTIVFLLLLVAAGYWLTLDQEQAGQQRGPRVTAVTAWVLEQQPFQSRVNALGTLRAWESVVITSSVSETVAALYFEDGETVEKGKLLVTLQQEEEQASLREQQEFLREQDREVARLENLARSNQVAQTELDQRRTMAAIARNRIEREKALIEDRNITAPFAGILGLRQVSAGALVAPGQVITTLDDTSRMRLDFTVPARFLRFLEPGQVLEAGTAAYPQSFNGELAAVDSRVDPVNRSITARASFDNAEGLLKPGLLMQVVVLGDMRETLLIPEESLLSRGGQHFVWLVEEQMARRVEVEIGDRRPGWVEITAGLNAGNQIVRDGVSRLRGQSAGVKVLDR